MSTAPAIPDPSLSQRLAADPGASVWVTASAGSGKTKVLTDRVLSLLLGGTAPERILCLTFTKAAAAEMSIRVNDRLSRWATAADDALSRDLAELTGEAPDDAACGAARRLFAQVLDAPGGLKIQTIHAFCQSLLGRFPIEAGLAPHFEVIDERSAAELVEAARDDVLLRSRTEPELAEALERVTEHVDEQRFHELMTTLGSARHRLDRFIEARGGIGPAAAAIRGRLGLAADDDDATIVARAAAEDAFDRAALGDASLALLESAAKGDRDRGRVIADWLAGDEAARRGGFDVYAEIFLTRAGTVRGTLATKPVRAAHPGIEATLEREARRLLAVQDLRRALVTARATEGLLRLGAALLASYDEAKRSLARLDYEDLILLTGRLLARTGVAPWVLFKLDGGIDHILIDEAQDTSPQQWAVIAGLAEEFFAGEGARALPRTVFAVGDVKQSIFSFQHADPEEFRRMREHFAARVRDSGGSWRPIALDVSFRSTDAVLGAVDAIFSRPAAAAGVVDPGDSLRHYAWRNGHAGLVELWPAVAPRERDEERPWTAPLSRRPADHPAGRLARVLAAQIARWIGRERLESRGRAVRPGDIMVLVRTRTAFVEALVRALKDLDVPVSGIDRMVLTDQIAVMDLVALGRFLLLPEDDLTLATVLKGPLVGLDDDDLFRLAHDRGGRSLWRRLAEQAPSEPRFEATCRWLAGLMSRVDYVRPYELFAEILAQPATAGATGRQRMLARLGPDADDPIDEFLGLAFAHERGHASSLEGFLHWVEAGEATVKRDLEQGGRDEVRIMTVHGSKGLQAPVVVLPDTMSKPRVAPTILWDGDMPVWPPRSALRDEVCNALLEAERTRVDAETRRLLYVAMTRAEDRLYVCGAEGRRTPADDCWYALVRDGLAPVAEREARAFPGTGDDGWSGDVLRLATPQSVAARPDRDVAAGAAGYAEPEPWMLVPAAPEPSPPRPLAPSRPAAPEPPVRSPVGDDAGERYRRGNLIHRLLEMLPALAVDARRTAGERYLGRPVHRLDGAARREILDEVLAVLDDPRFAALFGPGSRAEVPIAGLVEGPDGPETVSGQIDRLVVGESAVLIVDFKSNRPPPATMEEVPELYWRQMAAYRAVVARLYPDRSVDCALLWTDGPRLMPLSGPRLDPAHPHP